MPEQPNPEKQVLWQALRDTQAICAGLRQQNALLRQEISTREARIGDLTNTLDALQARNTELETTPPEPAPKTTRAKRTPTRGG